MSLWSKIIGTIETKFQLGLNGPQLKQISATEIGFRNSADGANVNASGLDPTTAQHFATKNYVDTGTLGGALREIRFAIGTTATQSSATSIPANAIVTRVQVTITTPYSAGATLSVGQTGSTSLLAGTSDNNAQSVGTYEVTQDTSWGASQLPVLVTVAGTPIAGVGSVNVYYATPAL